MARLVAPFLVLPTLPVSFAMVPTLLVLPRGSTRPCLAIAAFSHSWHEDFLETGARSEH